MDRMDLINPIQLPNNTIQHNTTQPTNEPTKQPTNKPTKTNQPNNQQLYNIRYKMFDLIENDSNHWAVFISIEPLLLRTNQKKKTNKLEIWYFVIRLLHAITETIPGFWSSAKHCIWRVERVSLIRTVTTIWIEE